jgi:cytochrome c553
MIEDLPMTRCLLALACIPFLALPIHARPAHKQALAQYFGPFLPKKLNACAACHLPDTKSEDDTDKPHNLFGARLKSIRGELKKAGKAATIDARLDAVLDEDSDGDGVSNLLEILAGHSPGDKADRPAGKELAEAKAKLVEFQRFRTSYPWRPFEVVKRPALPKVKNAAWVRNPIDAFIAAEHETHGLKPRPEAPREVLLRRVYLDLIGLPPTPADLHAFLNDKSANAYEKVVDDLLNRPQHGERWGRHWMDVWRYSDWAGYGQQVRDSQPHIWRWRDWIVDSLNADKGYDRMVLEMLAGDELAPDDSQALIATGYLVRNFKLLSREKWMQDTVEHTFQAFQATTIGCAKCHDHMFDPIQQTEYYQVRAIFEPHNVRTDPLPGQKDAKKDGLVRAYDKDLSAPTHFFIRGDDRTPDKNRKIVPGVPEALGGRFPKIEPIELAKDADKKKPAQSTGRRLAFARWLADRENPRTARVAVTHLWRRHFGQAIVPSVFDFGPNGRSPSHPALLDWLAAELMDGEKKSGWSMKHLHRLIVTSSVYRQSSTPDQANAQIDRDNKFLWRYAPHRLEAEAVRDCVFFVAGKLDPKLGGPDIDYPLGLTVPRRSLYFRHAAEKQMEFLQLFDAANVTECYERQHSIVPQQALALMNSELSLKHARILAGSIAERTKTPDAFSISAFEHVLSRAPNKAELAECVTFLAERTKAYQAATLTGGNVKDGSQPSADPAQRARENLVHALLNHHEFVTIR